MTTQDTDQIAYTYIKQKWLFNAEIITLSHT